MYLIEVLNYILCLPNDLKILLEISSCNSLKLTIKLMKVFHRWHTRNKVVEMKLQSFTLQQAISHLCKIDSNYCIRIPKSETSPVIPASQTAHKIHLKLGKERVKSYFDPFLIKY